MTTGIVATGVYRPSYQLQLAEVGRALGIGSAKGARSVAAYDEDTTTLAVAAARKALGAMDTAATGTVDALWFVTTAPAYLDKTNATAIHAALGLDEATAAFDCLGSVRSFSAALLAALRSRTDGHTIVTAADMRTGLPGSAEESSGGDAAAAIIVGGSGSDLVAEFLGHGAATAEFIERWRAPGDAGSQSWEDRFVQYAYGPLARRALDSALRESGLKSDDIDHLVVAGLARRTVQQVGRELLGSASATVTDASSFGNAGAAQPAIQLAEVLDSAAPGARICLLVLADGADCFILETTDRVGLRDRPADSTPIDVNYTTFLTWRGQLRREPPRRPDPDLPVPPSTFRERSWKFGFAGSRCTSCNTVHVPPSRVCAACGAVDLCVREPMADRIGTVVTVTTDHIAFSPDPPMRVAVVDFDGGGRAQCELTDVAPGGVVLGDRVAMTFRRAYTVNGVHNYVWKARPIQPDRRSHSE